MSDEVKVEIGGVSKFFLFAIPAVLALAAIGWLAFVTGVVDFSRTVSQEARHAEAVGAAPLPKKAIEVVLKNKRGECRVVDKAEVDGSDIWVYWHNACGGSTENTTVEWRGLAPDGTVVASGWHYTDTELAAGDKAEFHFNRVSIDPRIAAIEVKARWNNSY
jgi:hypothetical protein